MAGVTGAPRVGWPAATVCRDGVAVACWFAVERIAGTDSFRAFSMGRDAGGYTHHFLLGPGDHGRVGAALASGMRPPVDAIRPWPFLGSFAAGVRLLGDIERFAAGGRGDGSGEYPVEGPPFGPGGGGEEDRAAAADVTRATEGFLRTLDPVAVSFVRRSDDGCGVVDGRWWGIDATFGRGAPAMRAIERWPHLSRSVLLALACSQGEDFATGPDQGAALVAGAMSRGVPVAWAARNLDAIHAAHDANVRSDGFRGDPRRLDDTLAATGLVPAHARPGAGDTGAFLRCAPVVRDVTWVANPDDMARHLRVGRGWDAFERAIAGACGDVRPARAVRDVGDMLSSFKRQVLAPALHIAAMATLPDLEEGHGRVAAARAALRRGAVKSTVAASALLSGRSLARCLRDSAGWHAGSHRISAGLASLPGTLGRPPSWDAILPGMREGDLAVVVLTDAAALADEGRDGVNGDGTEGLRSCVGGYVAECVRSGTRVASLRRMLPGGGFMRLSTAQVAVRGGRVVPLQHAAMLNDEPSHEAAALLERYLAALADAGPYDDDAIPIASATGDDPCTPAGYDWFVPGNLEAAMAVWAPFMPRALRGMPPRGWAELEAWAHRDGPPAWRRLPFRRAPAGSGP